MAPVLAALHAVLALVAFGIGNAFWNGGGSTPPLLHLILGITLLVTAVSLWRDGRGVRWAVIFNLLLAGGVAGILVLDRLERGAAISMVLVAAAIAFAALEVYTITYPYSNGRAEGSETLQEPAT